MQREVSGPSIDEKNLILNHLWLTGDLLLKLGIAHDLCVVFEFGGNLLLLSGRYHGAGFGHVGKARPVRVGNGAWNQHQNDVWGMLLDGVDQHFKRGAAQIAPTAWEGLAALVEDAISHSGDADQGIWEIRGEPQHFTASAVLCWVAADRGADLAQRRGIPDALPAGAERPTG